jgi:hypothetical protein
MYAAHWHQHLPFQQKLILSAVCAARKRRLYACQDIVQLVQDLGLDCGPGGPAGKASPFELDLFDDTLYDSRNPHEWLPSAPGKINAAAAGLRQGHCWV